jgi:biotin carboxyl carrier protein
MVGKIIEVVVKSGGRVNAEDDLVVIESMKMEIPVAAPVTGVVREVHVVAGDTVQENDLLVTLDA